MERNEKGQFIKGQTRTTEEQLKISEGLRTSWKERDDYIADIVNECPKIYNSWRAFMFTEKGKKIGHSEEWNNFRNFYNDVRPTWQEGKVFRRLDITKPYGKDNFIWVTPEEANNMPKSNVIIIEFNGEKHTIKDWAEIIGTTQSAIQNRYHKHKDDFSIEEILYGRKKNRGSKTAKDVSDPNVNIRAKVSKMISSYNTKDVSNGFGKSDLTIEWMIDNIVYQPCTYCGDTYRIGCDRIDNNKGHNKDNIVPCCYECNCARNNNFTYDEMKTIGAAIRQVKENRKLMKAATDKGELIEIEIK